MVSFRRFLFRSNDRVCPVLSIIKKISQLSACMCDREIVHALCVHDLARAVIRTIVRTHTYKACGWWSSHSFWTERTNRRAIMSCARVFLCSRDVHTDREPRNRGHARATLGIPFKSEGSPHDLVLSTKFIAGRRVSCIQGFGFVRKWSWRKFSSVVT